MAKRITNIKILKTTNGTFYGVVGEELTTKEYPTIDEVAETINKHLCKIHKELRKIYDSCNNTLSYYWVDHKKKQPKNRGVVATMCFNVIKL